MTLRKRKEGKSNTCKNVWRKQVSCKIFWLYEAGCENKHIYSVEKKMSSPISRVLSWTVIHLGPASPQASSNLPESSAGHAIGLLFGLAPGGVYHRRGLLPATRCALTAPFHPYRCS